MPHDWLDPRTPRIAPELRTQPATPTNGGRPLRRTTLARANGAAVPAAVRRCRHGV